MNTNNLKVDKSFTTEKKENGIETKKEKSVQEKSFFFDCYSFFILLLENVFRVAHERNAINN